MLMANTHSRKASQLLMVVKSEAATSWRRTHTKYLRSSFHRVLNLVGKTEICSVIHNLVPCWETASVDSGSLLFQCQRTSKWLWNAAWRNSTLVHWKKFHTRETWFSITQRLPSHIRLLKQFRLILGTQERLCFVSKARDTKKLVMSQATSLLNSLKKPMTALSAQGMTWCSHRRSPSPTQSSRNQCASKLSTAATSSWFSMKWFHPKRAALFQARACQSPLQ